MLAVLAFALAIIAPTPPTPVGIDHIPIVVTDLERAEQQFRQLGFAIKPARPHDNGLRAAHAKFPDGTELELITSAAAVDDLSSEYLRFQAGGDGALYHGLYAPDREALAAELAAAGAPSADQGFIVGYPPAHPLHSLFFSGRQKSPTDRPEHFAHANGALRLAGLWLAGGEAERDLLMRLGAPVTATDCGPLGPAKATLRLREGRVSFLPAAASPRGRSLVAATVIVGSLAQTRRVFEAAGVKAQPSSCGAPSLWVAPGAGAGSAPGIWLQFREEA